MVLGPVCMICVAAVLPDLFFLSSDRPDLYDLIPRTSHLDEYALVAWCDLPRGYRSLKQGWISTGTSACVLGYMMRGGQSVREGQTVQRFILLPDAGNRMHSGHRFGDQMIDVNLPPATDVSFSEGRLVWVRGKWRLLAGDINGDQPLYQLNEARVEPAVASDIAKYFR